MCLLTRLTPVLPVGDVAAETEFYLKLGFARYIDPQETYPDDVFAAFEAGEAIRFGVAAEAGFDRSTSHRRLWWQFETSDIEALQRLASDGGLVVEQPLTKEAWGRRTLRLRSPNGYIITFEETATT